jgi:sensor c-di-GMP phosphodiesterase-like protein
MAIRTERSAHAPAEGQPASPFRSTIFGTGFSNLSYLRRFPVDRLKIDLSFVREITSDPAASRISEAIITMSHRPEHAGGGRGRGKPRDQQELLDDAATAISSRGYLYSPPVVGGESTRVC